MRAAVLSSSVPHAASVLEHVVRSAGPGDISSAMIEPLIATLTATNDRRAIARALAVVGGPDVGEAAKPVLWRLGAAAELLDSSRDQTLVEEPAVKALIASARKLAVDPAAPPNSRLVALRLLGRVPADRSADRELIARQLDPTESVEVQLAAVQALARLEDRPSAEAVVTRWPGLGPSVRSGALDAMLARPGSTEVLLTALEQRRLDPAAIDAAHREQLFSKGPDALRQRASKVFGSLAIGPRQTVLKSFATATTLHGDSERGKKVFQRICAACHQLGGIGHEVGPDLAALTDTVSRGLADRRARPEPRGRCPIRRLLRRSERRPRAYRPDRRRDRQRHHVEASGGSDRRDPAYGPGRRCQRRENR